LKKIHAFYEIKRNILVSDIKARDSVSEGLYGRDWTQLRNMSEPEKKKQKVAHIAIIADPLADKKLTKKILKLNKKGADSSLLLLTPFSLLCSL